MNFEMHKLLQDDYQGGLLKIQPNINNSLEIKAVNLRYSNSTNKKEEPPNEYDRVDNPMHISPHHPFKYYSEADFLDSPFYNSREGCMKVDHRIAEDIINVTKSIPMHPKKNNHIKSETNDSNKDDFFEELDDLNAVDDISYYLQQSRTVETIEQEEEVIIFNTTEQIVKKMEEEEEEEEESGNIKDIPLYLGNAIASYNLCISSSTTSNNNALIIQKETKVKRKQVNEYKYEYNDEEQQPIKKKKKKKKISRNKTCKSINSKYPKGIKLNTKQSVSEEDKEKYKLLVNNPKNMRECFYCKNIISKLEVLIVDNRYICCKSCGIKKKFDLTRLKVDIAEEEDFDNEDVILYQCERQHHARPIEYFIKYNESGDEYRYMSNCKWCRLYKSQEYARKKESDRK